MNAKLTLVWLLFLPAWLLPVAPLLGQPWRTLGDSRPAFPLNTIALSPDGKWLLAADISGAARVAVIDAANGKIYGELRGHGRYVNQFAFSADSRLVYTGGHPHGAGLASPDSAVVVWELDTAKRVKEFQAEIWALSPDGKVLLLAENVRMKIDDAKPAPAMFTLRLVETKTWKELGKIVDEGMLVSALAISSDGKTAAWAGSDYQIRLVDIQSSKQIRKFKQIHKFQAARTWIPGPKDKADQTTGITFLAWAPDGQTLASVTDTIVNYSEARTINIWDADSGKEIKKLAGPEQAVSGLAYTPKGDKLIVTGRHNQWLLYDMPAGKLLENKSGAWGSADVMLGLLRQGRERPADPPGFLSNLWDTGTGKDRESGSIPDRLFSLAALPDGKTIVTGEQGAFLRFWDLEAGKEIRRVHPGTFPKSNASTYGLAYSPADKCLISSHWNDDVKFWSPDGKLLGGVPNGTSYQHLAVARDGKIATTHHDGIHISPNRATRPVAVKIEATNSNIWSMQFSHDCNTLMVATWTGLHLIDVPGKKVVRIIEPKISFPNAALSPDGKMLATLGRHDRPGWAFLEKEIRLWDTQTGQELRKIVPVPPPDYGMICFSPDGRSLLTHHQGGMTVWEVETGQARSWASGKGKGFSANGRLLFSLTDKQVFVWDLTGEQTGGILKPVKHAPQTQADLWTDLQPKVDAAKAYRAMWRLAADAEQTVPFLKEKVATIGAIDPKAAKPAGGLSPPEKILACRIVELLEQIGTADAQRLLETLATPAKPQFTDAARQALARLTSK